MSDLKPSTGSDQTTPAPSTVRIPRAVRTAAATAGRMRASEERGAARLRDRGWVCIPPDHPLADQVVALLVRIDTK